MPTKKHKERKMCKISERNKDRSTDEESHKQWFQKLHISSAKVGTVSPPS
jgi:ribosomal protein L21